MMFPQSAWAMSRKGTLDAVQHRLYTAPQHPAMLSPHYPPLVVVGRGARLGFFYFIYSFLPQHQEKTRYAQKKLDAVHH
ncbi:MAG: hypothetical protein M3Z21_11475, partial [Pseudomonadota bacterium]|nr:hypothetical protein [Pseudomonadota bacterium]